MGAREPPLIVVVGATATGKSDAAVALAVACGGEIVGADSRQVYRGMAVGTAQPALALQAVVPHHLMGFLLPDAPFGLAEYLDRARTVRCDIRARGRVPIMVGGTGQYVRALLEGWEAPRVPPNWELRAELERFAAEHGATALHARLLAVDPTAAAAIHPHNVRRVVRALEVQAVTGMPASAQRGKSGGEGAVIVGLALPRPELYARIDARVAAMYRAGLLDEVRALAAAGYRRDLPSMSSIGYPEAWAVISGELSETAGIATTQAATRRLARQQGAWFRERDPRIRWVQAGPGAEQRVVRAVERALRDAEGE